MDIGSMFCILAFFRQNHSYGDNAEIKKNTKIHCFVSSQYVI